jgi:hypothetical protein
VRRRDTRTRQPWGFDAIHSPRRGHVARANRVRRRGLSLQVPSSQQHRRTCTKTRHQVRAQRAAMG